MNKKTDDLDLRKLAKLEAKLETCWWKSHHEKNWQKTIDCMAQLYVIQYKVPIKIAKEMVTLRVEAAKEHDLAERPGLSPKESNKHWAKVEKINEEHFFMLEKHRER